MNLINMNSKSLFILAAFSLLVVLPGAASAAYPEDPNAWKFDAQIYLWGASLGVETVTGVGIEDSFGDILSDLEMAFMGTFAAQKGKWAMIGDVIYLDLEQKESTQGPPAVDAKIELKGWIVNLMGGYALMQRERNVLNLAFGARYLGLDTDVNLNVDSTPFQLSKSDGAWNGVVGLQGEAGFAKHWYFNYLLDVGTGDSELTWQALAGLGYEFKNLDLKFGYRYLAWEFDDSDTFGKAFSKLDISGPYAGIKFKF